MIKRLLVVFAVLATTAAFATPASANSGSGFAPFPNCHPAIPANAFGPGQPLVALPSTGPCQETDHFGLSAFIAGPGGPCPPPFPGLIAVLGAGNGISHSNVNAADDWWATSTFEGTADVHAVLGFDSNGPILGPLLATGHQMQWFGNSLNANNFVLHDTGNISITTLTNPAQTFTLHFADHASSTGGNPYVFGVPQPNHTVFMKTVC